VSVSWGGGAEIFHAAHIAATLNGFRGHTPKCTLVSGSLPPGLQLQSDCAITGRPVATGTWYLTVRVAAAGVSGTLDFTAEGAVYGPTVAYNRLSFSPPHVPLGTEMRTAPEIESWNVDPDVPPTWTYEAASTLPPGLQLDPVTGVIGGAPSGEGSYVAEVQATLHTPYGTYQPPGSRYRLEVTPEALAYAVATGPSAGLVSDAPIVVLGESFALVPKPGAGSTLAAFSLQGGGVLPSWLSFDPATGTLSGRPTTLPPLAPSTSVNVGVAAVSTRAGVSKALQTVLHLDVQAPVTVLYTSDPLAPSAPLIGKAGSPLHVTPMWLGISPSRITFSAVPFASMPCSLPPGVALQPNGDFVGTPTVKGAYECPLEFTMEYQGAAWSQLAPVRLVVE